MEFSELTIFYVASDGTEWATFLKGKLSDQGIVSETKDIDSNCGNEYSNNVILATPAILELHTSDHIKSMDPSSSLMVLLGVDANDLKVSLLKLGLKGIFDWKLCEAKQTEVSVNKLIERIMSLLHNARFSSAMPKYDRLPAPRASMPELRHMASRHALLATPELRTATSQRDEAIDVYILSTRKGSKELQITLRGKEEQNIIQADFVDKVLYRLQLPETYNIEVESKFSAIDGKGLCTTGIIPQMPHIVNIRDRTETEFRSNIIQDIFGYKDKPVSLICTIFGLSDSNELADDLLDDHLADRCRKINSEKSADLNSSLPTETGCDKWPSLLHFAAEHNLKLFAAELLRLPNSIDACFSMNIDKDTPSMIANRNGFTEITRMIKSFTKVSSVLGRTVGNKDSGVFDERLETIQEHHKPSTELPSPDYDDNSTDKGKIAKAGNSLLDKWIEKMKKGKQRKKSFSTIEGVLREGTKDNTTKHLIHSKSMTLPHSHNY